MDILIFSGQSNMQGQTESFPVPNEEVRDAWEYHALTDTLRPLCHPVGEDIGDGLLLGAHGGNGSLIPAFCRAYVTAGGRACVAVHAARGATCVHEWLPPASRFDALTKKCRGAIAAAGQVDKVYFIWLQGESDAIIATDEETYIKRMKQLRKALGEELPIDGFFLIRVGKFTGDARDIPIIKAQEALASSGEFTMLTRLTGICTNDPQNLLNPYAAGHYNNAAMDMIGRRAGENLAAYVNGMPILLEEEPYPEVTACT